jgi:hypothetical protein
VNAGSPDCSKELTYSSGLVEVATRVFLVLRLELAGAFSFHLRYFPTKQAASAIGKMATEHAIQNKQFNESQATHYPRASSDLRIGYRQNDQ